MGFHSYLWVLHHYHYYFPKKSLNQAIIYLEEDDMRSFFVLLTLAASWIRIHVNSLQIMIKVVKVINDWLFRSGWHGSGSSYKGNKSIECPEAFDKIFHRNIPLILRSIPYYFLWFYWQRISHSDCYDLTQ